MRIVVTGRDGQLARSLVEAAAALSGVEVLTLGRPSFDLAVIESIAPALKTAGPDVVVNAAAYTAVDRAESDRDAALLINGAGAAAAASAAEAIGCPVIQVSTDFVFDGSAANPYREDAAPHPLNVYGASKLLGEQLVRQSARRHLIVRTSWVISPFGHNFVKTMLRLGAERPRLAVVDDQHGAPTYAPHLAAAILRMAELMARQSADDPRWGTYHVANGGATTWFGLAGALFDEAARFGVRTPEIVAIPSSEYPSPAQRPTNSRLDCGKLAQTFGLTLPPWQDGVRETIDRLLQPAAQ